MFIAFMLTACGFEPSEGIWVGSLPVFRRSDGWGKDDCEAERILGYDMDWTIEYELSVLEPDASVISLTERAGEEFSFTCEQTENHSNFYSCDYYESIWDLGQFNPNLVGVDATLTWFNTMGLKFNDSQSGSVEYELYGTCTGMECSHAADIAEYYELNDLIPIGLLREQNCESTPFFNMTTD